MQKLPEERPVTPMRTNSCRKPAEATGSGTRCPVRSHEKGYRLIMFGFYTPKILVELEQDVKKATRGGSV